MEWAPLQSLDRNCELLKAYDGMIGNRGVKI